MDYKLAWDPKEYGNITEIRLPWKKLWKPDILMYNRYTIHCNVLYVYYMYHSRIAICTCLLLNDCMMP